MTPADESVTLAEEVRTSYALRNGGRLGLAEDAIYVVRGDDEPVRVDADDVVEVQYDSFDWFLGVVSLCLVAFGLYSTTRNVLGGLAFAAAGAASLYLTYRKRGKLTFRVKNRPKPLTVYPTDGEDTYEALRPLMD